MAGGLSDEVDEKSKEFQQFRQSVGPEKFDAFQAKYSWLDAGKFTPHAAPATVFLQYATQEDFLTPERARVCRDCQRTEAVQTLGRTACAQRRSPPRPHRVRCRAAQPKAGSVASSDRRDSQASSSAQPGHAVGCCDEQPRRTTEYSLPDHGQSGGEPEQPAFIKRESWPNHSVRLTEACGQLSRIIFLIDPHRGYVCSIRRLGRSARLFP
jgi:hypothetical protein